MIIKREKSDFYGDYENWEKAAEKCRGYAADNILEKVSESISEVINGNAIYERDSCLFYETKYEHNLLTYIFMAYLEKNTRRAGSKFIVVDWGGSLGSIYLQHREILERHLPNLEWIIVEQKNFVKHGKELLNFANVRFWAFDDEGLDVYLKENCPDLILFRSSLQYIENWKAVLEQAMSYSPKWLILDRIVISDRERICIQHVPKHLYSAEYPVRIFDRKILLDKLFKKGYSLIEERKSGLGEYDFSQRLGRFEVNYMFYSLKLQK